MNRQRPDVVVRTVRSEDFPDWLPLWEAYLRFYQVDLPQANTEETWRRFLDPSEPMTAAVALEGGRLVGTVTVVWHRSTWAVNDYCYLEDLFVAADARGKGVGTLLVKWVQALAFQKNCARLYWHTHENNHQAQKLYDRIGERAGFIEYRLPIVRVDLGQ